MATKQANAANRTGGGNVNEKGTSTNPNAAEQAASRPVKLSAAEQEAARTAKTRGRRARLKALLDDPQNELWLLRLPVAPQLSTKLSSFTLDYDPSKDADAVSGTLFKNYVIRDLNVSKDVRVALRDQAGNWEPPRPVRRSLAVSFIPNSRPFNTFGSAVPKDSNLEVVDFDADQAPTKLQPRFPVAGSTPLTSVPQKLKDSLDSLVREKEMLLPKLEQPPVEIETYEEDNKTEDEAENLPPDNGNNSNNNNLPGMQVDGLQKSKSLIGARASQPAAEKDSKKNAGTDGGNNIVMDIDMNLEEDPLSQPPTTANTPDAGKSPSMNKALSDDVIPLLSDAAKLPPAAAPIAVPDSEPTQPTQEKIKTTNTEAGKSGTENKEEDDGMGPFEGNTIDVPLPVAETKSKKKSKKKRKSSSTEGEVKEEDKGNEEEYTKKTKKKKRKSRNTEDDGGNGVKEEANDKDNDDGMSKKKKKKKRKTEDAENGEDGDKRGGKMKKKKNKKRRSYASKDEEVLEGENERRRLESNISVVKEIEEEEKKEEKEEDTAQIGVTAGKKSKKKKSKKRKLDRDHVPDSASRRKSKKRKSVAAVEE